MRDERFRRDVLIAEVFEIESGDDIHDTHKYLNQSWLRRGFFVYFDTVSCEGHNVGDEDYHVLNSFLPPFHEDLFLDCTSFFGWRSKMSSNLILHSG